MTAYEKVGDEYYAQGSDEYYAALQSVTEPVVDVAFIIARELTRNDYGRVPAIIVRSAPRVE